MASDWVQQWELDSSMVVVTLVSVPTVIDLYRSRQFLQLNPCLLRYYLYPAAPKTRFVWPVLIRLTAVVVVASSTPQAFDRHFLVVSVYSLLAT